VLGSALLGSTSLGKASHISVLYKEALAGLNVVPGGRYIDGTVGAGGHAAGILRASDPDGRLLGLDVDPAAIAASRERLATFKNRVTLVQSNYARLREVAEQTSYCPADGVLLDLGVSSMQLANGSRGFSFLHDGPLDMRLDQTSPRTAAQVVNALPEEELADLIYRYGEEPASRAIARAIVAARPLHTTGELARTVEQAVRTRRRATQGRRGIQRKHPATRTFQAVRIAVNAELENLELGLEAAIAVLGPGGRLAVITFHSLEDRIVKRTFVREARDCICPAEALVCTCNHRATIAPAHRKPIRPNRQEVDRNPRSRSAKLRIVEKK
jgi:16S rRNA (cytosine1402-N4)-methyltransferase